MVFVVVREIIVNHSILNFSPQAPLSLTFINDTPRVSYNNIRADFKANREGLEISCYIPGLGNKKIDCKLLSEVADYRGECVFYT